MHRARASSFVVLASIASAACSPATVPPDALDAAAVDSIAIIDASDVVSPPVDTGNDAPDPHDGLRLPRCEDTEPAGSPMLTPVASTLVGTIVPMAARLASADGSNNTVFERGELSYRARGFDQYAPGPAQDRVRRIDLGDRAATTATRHSLLYFVHFSDIQLVDDESPTRLALVESPDNSGGVRPQEGYLARATSAMNRTLAALARPERPFAFGVISGDCTDSAQHNELTWFLDLLDGRTVHTDSGNPDDPIPGPDNDPKDPFTSVAFPAPWYYVPGNHDVEVVGIALPDDRQRMTALGNNASTGTRDYSMWWAEPRRGRVVPDPDRRLMSRAEIVHDLQNDPATPGPAGHGFPAGNVDITVGANYVVDLVPNLVRLIALDTSNDTGGSHGLVHRATVDRFLRPALDAALRDGVLVMLDSHHPTSAINTAMGEIGNPIADAVDGPELATLAASYPNVIAWLVGHDHRVRINPIGADATHNGYWEIQSGSIADWPNQARVVEIVDNGNGTLSIFGTMVDYTAMTCMERRYRRLALMDYLSAWAPDLTGTAVDRNVELIVPVPSAAMSHLAAFSASAPTRIESETTLRGMR